MTEVVAMRRILHILPVPVPEAGLDAFRAQLPEEVVDPDVAIIRPDATELRTGKEHTVFPRLLQEWQNAIEADGAQVIILGSTTMHQSHRYLSGRLDVPVINPGVVAHQVAQQFLRAGLSHSRYSYPSPATTAEELLAPFASGAR